MSSFNSIPRHFQESSNKLPVDASQRLRVLRDRKINQTFRPLQNQKERKKKKRRKEKKKKKGKRMREYRQTKGGVMFSQLEVCS